MYLNGDYKEEMTEKDINAPIRSLQPISKIVDIRTLSIKGLSEIVLEIHPDCIGDSIDSKEPKGTFGSSGTTESPI